MSELTRRGRAGPGRLPLTPRPRRYLPSTVGVLVLVGLVLGLRSSQHIPKVTTLQPGQVLFARSCGAWESTPDPWQQECAWERDHQVLPLPVTSAACDSSMGPVTAEVDVARARDIGQYVGVFGPVSPPEYDIDVPAHIVVFADGWLAATASNYAGIPPGAHREICIQVAGEHKVYLVPSGTPY